MSSQLSKSTKENQHAGPMYYAYVRFIDDGKRHILPIRDIQNFKPSNLKDFKPRKVYSAKWKDDVQDGFFGAQIVKLFGKFTVISFSFFLLLYLYAIYVFLFVRSF